MTEDTIPDGSRWSAVPDRECDDDTVAAWDHPEGMQIRVDEVAFDMTDEDTPFDEFRELCIVLERTIRADGYETTIQTFANYAPTIDDAVASVTDMMGSITRNVVTAIAAREMEVEGEDTVEFYCVFDDYVPAGIDPDDLQLGGDDGVEIGPSANTDVELDDDQRIRVDIYPKFAHEVREVNGD